MENFNVTYYADYVTFLYCLHKNYDDMSTLGLCQESFNKVSKESILRDFASRAFYTSFLHVRKELALPKAMHETLQPLLEPKYKNMFKEMKAFRVHADYNVDTPLISPLRRKNNDQYYPERLLSIMNTLLSLSGEALATDHSMLNDNRKRNNI